jgi:multiple sugar transport system permease protein
MLFNRKEKIVGILIIIMYLLLLYIPIYWLLVTSFKNRIDITAFPPRWVFSPTVRNYIWIFSVGDVTRGIYNSLIVSTATLFLALVLGLPCAYGLSRFRFKGRDDLKFWIITVRMLPPVAAIIPFYHIWRSMGLYDTYISLIISYLLIALPLVIWLTSGFFQKIPKDIEEAAALEGANDFVIFTRISLPLAVPGVLVSSIFAFIFVWNDLFFAFVLTSTPKTATLPVAMASLMTHGLEVKWGEMAAAGVISALPAVVFAIIGRKLLIEGIMKGLSGYFQ